eukprot:m.239481 g.239481  ORF g.239481 m.239481 type:complete len:873 (-) comp13490_c0_seq1:114-2732(-)
MSIKAFEVAPFLDSISKDKAKVHVECLEVYDDTLWVGTTDGFIREYALTTTARAVTARLQEQQCISKGKPIQHIMAIPPPHNLILVLVDGKFVLLTTGTLQDVQNSYLKKISSVRHYCRNPIMLDSANTFEVTYVQKKSNICNIEINFDSAARESVVGAHKDFRDMSADAVMKSAEITAIARDGFTLCLAVQSSTQAKYVLCRLNQSGPGAWMELVDFNPVANPMCLRVVPGEFLLSVFTDPQTIGMFVSDKGAPSRAPLEWTNPPAQVSYHNPYVVANCPSVQLLDVHSILDQQRKQVIPTNDLRAMNDTDEDIYLGMPNGVALLRATPFEDQINQLLDHADRVMEALQLAQVAYGSRRAGESADTQKLQHIEVYRRAGTVLVRAGAFGEAVDCMFRAGLDPRTVVTLFPGLFLRAPVRLDELHTDLQSKILSLTADPAKFKASQVALAGYLKRCRSHRNHADILDLIDSALAVALATADPAELIRFVSGPNNCVLADVTTGLQKYNCHHAYAILLASGGQPEKALEIWKGLSLGPLEDPVFPGIAFVTDFLRRLQNAPIVLAHASEWVLGHDPKAVSIFTERDMKERKDLFNPDKIVEVLSPFPSSLDVYLEYLISGMKNEDERFHTRLAMVYLERLRRIPRADPGFSVVEEKLKKHLHRSNRYNVDAILRQIANTDLHYIHAILQGKAGNHQKALGILVHTLNDADAAARYCVEYTRGKDRAARCSLFEALLAVYLARSEDPTFMQRAIDLLNADNVEMDAARVLRLLPDTWSITTVYAFLRRSILQSGHAQRSTRIQRGLTRAVQINTGKEHADMIDRRVVITDETRCQVCDGRMLESAVAYFPNGVLAHERCIRDPYVCPLSHISFS